MKLFVTPPAIRTEVEVRPGELFSTAASVVTAHTGALLAITACVALPSMVVVEIVNATVVATLQQAWLAGAQPSFVTNVVAGLIASLSAPFGALAIAAFAGVATCVLTGVSRPVHVTLDAVGRGALPIFAISLGATVAIEIATLALLLPGILLALALFPIAAVLVAEPGSPRQIVQRTLDLTHGSRGWLFLVQWVLGALVLASAFAAELLVDDPALRSYLNPVGTVARWAATGVLAGAFYVRKVVPPHTEAEALAAVFS